MSLVLDTPPASEPITTAEAKSHLRVDISDDDTLIDSLVTAARVHVENITRRQLITATWVESFDCFPDNRYCPIYLSKPPLASVSSIEYVDTDGNTTTWSSSNYRVDTASQPGRITPAYNEDWPTDVRDVTNAVSITYVAGYGSATDVPGPIRSAILLLVAHWYENREAVVIGATVKELPIAVDHLLSDYLMRGYH